MREYDRIDEGYVTTSDLEVGDLEVDVLIRTMPARRASSGLRLPARPPSLSPSEPSMASRSMRSTVRPRWSRVPEPTCRASLSDASNSRTHASPLSRSTVSWRGAVLFHLSADDQRSGLEDVAEWLTPGGRFLFTSGDLEGKRDGLMDGVPFHHVTLGVARYSQAIEGAGMQLLTHHCDAWDNHVYLAERPTVLETTHATSRTTAEPSEERSRPSLRNTGVSAATSSAAK